MATSALIESREKDSGLSLLIPRFHRALPATLAVMYASPTGAQTPAPATPPVYGPAISGMCLFSQTQAVARSKAGIAANQQLTALVRSTEGDLGSQRTAILNDGRALAGIKAKMASAEYDQREQQLQQRAKTFDQLAKTRSRQLQQTRLEVSGEIGRALGPVDEVPDPQTCGCDEDEAEVAFGGFVVSGGQSAVVFEL